MKHDTTTPADTTAGGAMTEDEFFDVWKEAHDKVAAHFEGEDIDAVVFALHAICKVAAIVVHLLWEMGDKEDDAAIMTEVANDAEVVAAKVVEMVERHRMEEGVGR